MRLLLAGLLVAAAAGVATARRPPPPDPKPAADIEARARFSSGMAHYTIEDYDGAIKDFQAGYLVKTDALFLFNIAQAYRLSQRPQKAIDYYRRYLRQSPAAENRAFVETTIADLERAPVATPPPPVKPTLPLPPAQPVVESATGSGYLSLVQSDGQPYLLVGLGVRKVFGFKVYAMGLFVEYPPARAALEKVAQRVGGRELAKLTADDIAQSFILLGDFGRLAQLHFVRGVSKADLQSSYRDSLKAELPSPSPQLQRDVDKFVALFHRDIKAGEECVIRTSAGGEISVELAGMRISGPTNPQLANAIWSIWLGKRPISSELRRDLVNRLDALLK